VLACLLAFCWLKARHYPAEAIAVASAFVRHAQARQFAQAHELTTRSGSVGANPAQLEEASRRELCNATRVASTSPFQSNGNRLRRWLSGTSVEMPEIRVEFEGACLLGVTVRHTPHHGWRVSRFASHAG